MLQSINPEKEEFLKIIGNCNYSGVLMSSNNRSFNQFDEQLALQLLPVLLKNLESLKILMEFSKNKNKKISVYPMESSC